MDTLTNKDLRKAREELIRYLMTLPDSRYRYGSNYHKEGGGYCLCAKGQTVKKFFPATASVSLYGTKGKISHYPFTERKHTVQHMLGITQEQWNEMEERYEGEIEFNRHTFKQIATWLQTLEGWPTVL